MWSFQGNDDPLKTRRWFQIFLFSPLLGEMIQFDKPIFQRGWNHQPEKVGYLLRKDNSMGVNGALPIIVLHFVRPLAPTFTGFMRHMILVYVSVTSIGHGILTQNVLHVLKLEVLARGLIYVVAVHVWSCLHIYRPYYTYSHSRWQTFKLLGIRDVVRKIKL